MCVECRLDNLGRKEDKPAGEELNGIEERLLIRNGIVTLSYEGR